MDTKTLVVPLDGSEYAERAIPVAAALAGRIGGRLLLLTAEFTGAVRPTEYLVEVAQRDFGCPVDTAFERGKYPAAALLDLLEDRDDCTLCMTTHGRGRVAWAAAGSVAEGVLRQVRRPVVLVGPHCRPDFFAEPGRMLIASAGDSWAGDVVDGVCDWSERLDLERRVVAVVHPLDVDTTEHPARLVDGLAAQFRVDPRAVALLHDEYPPGAILRAREAMHASMIVLGTHARHGLARLAMGSVTVAVVRQATCPVLVIARPYAPRSA